MNTKLYIHILETKIKLYLTIKAPHTCLRCWNETLRLFLVRLIFQIENCNPPNSPYTLHTFMIKLAIKYINDIIVHQSKK